MLRNRLYFLAGTVKKLLHQVGEEKSIRIDEAKITFPMTSKDDVRCKTRAEIE